MQKLQDLVRELEEEKAARAREHDSTSANQASWENYRQELLRALEETKRICCFWNRIARGRSW